MQSDTTAAKSFHNYLNHEEKNLLAPKINTANEEIEFAAHT
jgi:hypothetical protein